MDQQSYSEVKLADATRCSFSIENMTSRLCKTWSYFFSQILLHGFEEACQHVEECWSVLSTSFRMTEIHN